MARKSHNRIGAAVAVAAVVAVVACAAVVVAAAAMPVVHAYSNLCCYCGAVVVAADVVVVVVVVVDDVAAVEREGLEKGGKQMVEVPRQRDLGGLNKGQIEKKIMMSSKRFCNPIRKQSNDTSNDSVAFKKRFFLSDCIYLN